VLHVLRLCPGFEPPPSALDPRFVAFNPVGGVQSHAAHLTRGLDRHGVAQTVLTSPTPTAPFRERIGRSAVVLRLGLPVARRRGFSALAAAAVAPVLARRADVVHAHFTVDLGLVPVAIAVARMHGLPLVATIHCSLQHTLVAEDERSAAIQRRGGAVERWLARSADAVVALTPRLRELLDADGIDPERLHVIPSGVDPDRFPRAPADPFPGVPRPRIVSVGRLEPEKDVEVVVRAAARLRHPAHVVIVGDGSRRPALAALARRLGIAERVRLTGYLPATELPGVLAHADVLVHPARIEELGTAVVEAMFAGLPVVAGDCGGIPVDDGVEGIRAPVGDVAAFAVAIDRLLADPALAARLGGAGRRRARREHDWRVLSARVRDVYEQVLARRPGPVRHAV
jgi:glycosyltransferase involved in cell wall biosynthesis